MENLLRTSFERRILRKIVNRHSYYHKNISLNRQLFQKRKKQTLRGKLYI